MQEEKQKLKTEEIDESSEEIVSDEPDAQEISAPISLPEIHYLRSIAPEKAEQLLRHIGFNSIKFRIRLIRGEQKRQKFYSHFRHLGQRMNRVPDMFG